MTAPKSNSKVRRSPSRKAESKPLKPSDNLLRTVIDDSILNMIMNALNEDSETSPGDIEPFHSQSQGVVLKTFRRSDSPETPSNIGQRFGKWVVVSPGYQNPSCREAYFLLRCECGAIDAKPQSAVISGQSVSCGCGKKVRRGNRLSKTR